MESKVEGPNDRHCYRVVIEAPKPGRFGKNGAKVRITGPWQGDKRTADRDEEELRRAYKKGGTEELFRQKSALRRGTAKGWSGRQAA